MENIRNRKKIVLVNNRKSASWQNSKPTFKRFSIFDENLVGIELAQTNIVLDKPIYVSTLGQGNSLSSLSSISGWFYRARVIKAVNVSFPLRYHEDYISEIKTLLHRH